MLSACFLKQQRFRFSCLLEKLHEKVGSDKKFGLAVCALGPFFHKFSFDLSKNGRSGTLVPAQLDKKKSIFFYFSKNVPNFLKK